MREDWPRTATKAYLLDKEQRTKVVDPGFDGRAVWRLAVAVVEKDEIERQIYDHDKDLSPDEEKDKRGNRAGS